MATRAALPKLAGRRADLVALASVGGWVPDGWEFFFRAHVFKPRSVGRVRLRSADPLASPRVDLAYFSDADDYDLAVMQEAVEAIRCWAARPPLSDLIATERWPGAAVHGPDLAAFLRASAYTFHHPSGSCKMGPITDPLAVADQCGRVHGFEGLYVADASLMPSIPAASLNFTCLTIGERLADLLH